MVTLAARKRGITQQKSNAKMKQNKVSNPEKQQVAALMGKNKKKGGAKILEKPNLNKKKLDHKKQLESEEDDSSEVKSDEEKSSSEEEEDDELEAESLSLGSSDDDNDDPLQDDFLGGNDDEQGIVFKFEHLFIFSFHFFDCLRSFGLGSFKSFCCTIIYGFCYCLIWIISYHKAFDFVCLSFICNTTI